MKKTCKHCNPFCHSLDDITREMLCGHITVTFLKPKQVQSFGSNEQLGIVAGGVFLTFTLLENGSQESIELVKEGDILGTHLLSNSVNYPEYYLMPLTEAKLCSIPLQVIKNQFNQNLHFAQVLLQSISQLHARNSIHSVNMNSKKGEDKVEYIYQSFQNLKIDMNIITQEDLALIAGVSRITVARAMKKLFNRRKNEDRDKQATDLIKPPSIV